MAYAYLQNIKDHLIYRVCRLYTDGVPPGEIADTIEKQTGARLNRTDVFRLLREAALRRRLRYRPINLPDAAKTLSGKYDCLKGAIVTDPSIDAIATAAADRLYSCLVDHLSVTKPEVRICISGSLIVQYALDKIYTRLLYPDQVLLKKERELRDNAQELEDQRAAIECQNQKILSLRQQQLDTTEEERELTEMLEKQWDKAREAGRLQNKTTKYRIHIQSITPAFNQYRKMGVNGSLTTFHRNEFWDLHKDTMRVIPCGALDPQFVPSREEYSNKAFREEAMQADIILTTANSVDSSISSLHSYAELTPIYQKWRTFLEKNHGQIGNWMLWPMAPHPLSVEELNSAAERFSLENGIDISKCPTFPNTSLCPHDLPGMIQRMPGGCDVIFALPPGQTEKQRDRIAEIAHTVLEDKRATYLVAAADIASRLGASKKDTIISEKDRVGQIIGENFTRGESPKEIADIVFRDEMANAGNDNAKRQAVYKVLQRKSFSDHIIYDPLPHEYAGQELQRMYEPTSLKEVLVCDAHLNAVADHAAILIYRLIVDRLQVWQEDGFPGRFTISVAFAASAVLVRTVRALDDLLLNPEEAMQGIYPSYARAKSKDLKQDESLPAMAKLTFRSLLPTFSAKNLDWNPNGTLHGFNAVTFTRQKGLFEMEVAGMDGPALFENVEQLKAERRRTEALSDAAREADIVVLSGCSLHRKKNILWQYDGRSKEQNDQTSKWMDNEKCVGTMLGWPVTIHGPLSESRLRENLEEAGGYYPNTLLRPEDLAPMVASGKEVILLMPGADGKNPPESRGDIRYVEREMIKWACRSNMITRLVVGSTIARQLVPHGSG